MVLLRYASGEYLEYYRTQFVGEGLFTVIQ